LFRNIINLESWSERFYLFARTCTRLRLWIAQILSPLYVFPVHILLLIIILCNMSRVSSHYHLQYLPHLGVWRLPLQISSLVLWPFLSATLFVIGTCYIDQGVSLLLIFDIVFISYKSLPVHCMYVLLCFERITSFNKWH
jgi:hypothetical protein